MFPAYLPENISDWNSTIIRNLIDSQIDENQWLEFKEYFLNPQPPSQDIRNYKKKIEEILCSFANSKGGFVIFGVTKNHPRQIRGINVGQNEEMGLKASELIQNAVPFPAVEVSVISIESKNVLVVKIRECLEKPVMCSNGSYHIRLNGKTEPLPRDYLRDMFVSIEGKKQKYDRLKFELDYMIQLINSEPRLVQAVTMPLFYKLRLDDLQSALSDYYGYLNEPSREAVKNINTEIIKLRKENEFFKLFLLVEEKKRYGLEYTTLNGLLNSPNVQAEFSPINNRIAESFTTLKILVESLLNNL